MADPPDYPDTEPDRGSTTRTPPWVKVFGIIALVVVLLFVIMLVAGGGRHGPGMHRQSEGGPGRPPLPGGVTELGLGSPTGGAG